MQKSSATTSSSASSAPPLTPLGTYKSPRDHPDWCPELQSIGRVYMPLAPKEKSFRQQLRNARMDPDLWGDRCGRCGSTLVKTQPGFHRTYECTATHLSAVGEPCILTTFISTTPRHLLVTSGPKTGIQLCWEWNIRRTMDTCCYLLNCTLDHSCSLCLSAKHRAIDCDAHQYLPPLPPRPSTICSADVDLCRANWIKKNAAPPPKYQLAPLKRKTVLATTPLIMSSPSPSSTQLPVPLVSAPPQLQRYKVKDSWWTPVAREPLPDPVGTHVYPPSQHIAPPSIAYRDNDDVVNGSPVMHCYPREVPSCIEPRHGYRSRIPLSELTELVPKNWLSGFKSACINASRLLPHHKVDFNSVKSDDATFKKIIMDLESSINLDTSQFDIPEFKKTGDKRFQSSDGSAKDAGLCILMHYPPPHRVPFAFTPSKDASSMLAEGGMASPTVTGNYQLCYQNTIPIFFQIPDNALPAHAQIGTISKYPSRIITACINHRAQQILDRATDGKSQFIFAYGETPGKVVKKVVELATASEFHQMESITWRCRPIREWEQGLVCLATMLLQQNHFSTRRSVNETAPLFMHTLDKVEDAKVLADQSGLSMSNSIDITFHLLRDIQHPQACIVLVSTYHPTYASHVFGHSELSIGTTMDFVTTLAEDLYFDRDTTRLYPPPSCRFAQRKANAVLNDDAGDSTLADDCSLSKAHVKLLTDLGTHMAKAGKTIVPNVLPKIYRNLHAAATLVPDDEGIPLDPNDAVAIILEINRSRAQRSLQIRSKTTATEFSVTSSAVPIPATVPTSSGFQEDTQTTSIGTPYISICECGDRHTSSVYKFGTGIPVLTLTKVSKGGKGHPQTANKAVGEVCIVGIPVSSLQEAERCFIRSSSRSQRVMPLGQYRARVVAAFVKHVGPA